MGIKHLPPPKPATDVPLTDMIQAKPTQFINLDSLNLDVGVIPHGL